MRNEEVVKAFLNHSSATNKHGTLVSNGTQLLSSGRLLACWAGETVWLRTQTDSPTETRHMHLVLRQANLLETSLVTVPSLDFLPTRTRKPYQPEPSVILGFMRRIGTNSYAHVVYWFPRIGHVRVPEAKEYSSGHFTWSDAIRAANQLAMEMQKFIFEPII